MDDAYTVIPFPSDKDKAGRMKAAMRQVLPYATIASLLQCICVCATIDDVPQYGGGYHEIDAAASVGNQFLLYDDLKNGAGASRNSDVIVLQNAEGHFVCALLTLMLWCLLNEERSLSFYLVEKDFQRLQGWSYRYLWRQLAADNEGLSMDMVIAMTENIHALCGAVQV